MKNDPRQEEIIQEFELLGGDAEMMITYLIELGQKAPAMSEEEKTDDILVKGCQSKVWLRALQEGNNLCFKADSNSVVTKGLVSILVRIFNCQTPEETAEKEVYFMERSGLSRYIGTQRSNGFGAMVKQIRYYGLAYQANKKT